MLFQRREYKKRPYSHSQVPISTKMFSGHHQEESSMLSLALLGETLVALVKQLSHLADVGRCAPLPGEPGQRVATDTQHHKASSHHHVHDVRVGDEEWREQQREWCHLRQEQNPRRGVNISAVALTVVRECGQANKHKGNNGDHRCSNP